MTQQIKMALRAAIFQALATLGEKETQAIIDQCMRVPADDHWNPQHNR